MPCMNPCRLYTHLAFTHSVGPSSIVWNELRPAPPFHQWECLKCNDHGLSVSCVKWPLILIHTRIWWASGPHGNSPLLPKTPRPLFATCFTTCYVKATIPYTIHNAERRGLILGPSRSLARNIVTKDLMAPKFGEFDSGFLHAWWTTTLLKCAPKILGSSQWTFVQIGHRTCCIWCLIKLWMKSIGNLTHPTDSSMLVISYGRIWTMREYRALT